jgi:hypothetical protein
MPVPGAVRWSVLFTILLPGYLPARPQDGSGPRNPSLELDLLESEGKIYELKEKARAAAQLNPQDTAVLGHHARVSDVFGDRSAEAYERWAEALVQSGAPQSKVTETLERGIVVALRDGDRERAGRLSKRLGMASPYARLWTEQASPSAAGLTIPGGTAALAQAVEMAPSIPASRFMSEYARALLRRKNFGEESKRLFDERLKLYFEVIRTLASHGRPGPDATEIILDVANPAAVEQTDRVLAALGWQLRRLPRSNALLEVAPGADNGVRQQFGSTLGIDEADMKLTLEAKKPFVLQLRNDRVPILLEPPFWEKLTARDAAGRGLLEDMLYNPRVAGLYVALSNMNAETQRTLLSVMPMEELLNRARPLSLYGASISIEKGTLTLPGGAEATEAWTKLVEADPTQIRTFLRNLTKKDGGKLLAYYHALAVLPLRNQRFFTRHPSRLARFYRAFPFVDERIIGNGPFFRKEDQFNRLARELPLDDSGNVRFPGSDRVWMTATDSSNNADALQRLLQSASRIRAPVSEDEILLDLLDREYENDLHQKFRRIQNFLAVARIDAHRHQPMDELMALSLAQNYAKYESVFPYFAELNELTGRQTTSFFLAAQRLEGLEGVELNTALGEFHSLIKLVTLLNQATVIPDVRAAELFALVCDNFARIQAPRDVAAVSFDLVERILSEINIAAEDADERLARAFAGPDLDRQFTFLGSPRSVNLGAANMRRMRDVLRLQSIVPLEVLLQTYRAALNWTEGVDPKSLAQVEENLTKIVEISPTERDRLPREFANDVLIGRPSELNSLFQKLKRQLAAKKPSATNVSKLANDFIVELNPFLKTTLCGWIYAYYMSPSDLAASNRYFTRGHRFSDTAIRSYWPKTHLREPAIGSGMVGGFAQIGTALGDIAAVTVDSTASVVVYHIATKQLSAVRSVPWHAIAPRSIHLTALRIRLGREFIVQAAFSEPLRDVLESASTGLLGQARRHELLHAVRTRDASYAMSLLTAFDLFLLADSFIQPSINRGNSAHLFSAYTNELRLVPLQQVDYFGGIHTETAGCTHPHIVSSSPYEDYAEHYSATPLAERMSAILLEVMESADRTTLPVEVVGMVAERAVREFFRQTKSTPREDWLSAAQAMSSIDLSTFVESLEKP